MDATTIRFPHGQDELERVYQKVDSLEETVADLQHSLGEARRVARGNGGNHDGDGEDCRDSGGDEAQHGRYEVNFCHCRRRLRLNGKNGF